MSRNLFIRVSVETYNEEDVLKAWPRLFSLVWSDEQPSLTRGVLQLAQSITDVIKFSLVPHDEKSRALSKELETLLYWLEKYLADQNVTSTKKVVDDIEATLDKLEASFA